MLRENFIKQKLKAGQAVLGTWCVIPSAATADIIASTGMDFLIIDSEHGPIGFETAQEMVMACEARGVSPIMRVGGVIESDILKALDIGVHGLQIPNVNSKDDVLEIVRMSKYPPTGNRGYSPFTRAGDYSIKNSTTLTEKANKNTLLGINVEGKDAIENIDSILAIENLDIIFIGLFDLSKALGIPGQVNDPQVMSCLEDLVRKIKAAGKYPGTIATTPEKMKEFLAIGFKYLPYLVDCEMLRASYADVQAKFQEWIDG
jgi:4-hydroxy-2-oxoheptanedioate aldolase